ncbi:uncharacterized protein Dvar_65410 [Desulfosarcina variabilis str. Montpellier]|uniref:PilZ domain-containing protein n=1 Tax=Desulfosarcina variabilis TaxID=2300 RepID=UPI003AFA0DF2
MNLFAKNDKRQFPRRPAFIIADYTVREGTFRDIIKNIGARGVFISTWRKIAQGQPIELRFPVFEFDDPLTIRGTVVLSNVKGFSVVFDHPIDGLICKEGEFPEIVHESER